MFILTLEQYTYLLAHPQEISLAEVSQLDDVLEKYPYFQSARALQLKGLKKQGSYRYNDALKLTAAHTTDRDILFEYITSEKFVQNEISQAILQHDPSVMEIPVDSEDVSEEILREEDNRFSAEKIKAEAILNPNLFQRKVASVVQLTQEKSSQPESESTSEGVQEPISEEVDRPLEFTKEDTHSFSQWLQLTKAKPIDRENNQEQSSPKIPQPETGTQRAAESDLERKFELIDKFIQERPKIIPDASGSTSKNDEDKAGGEIPKFNEPYSQSPDALMTETLAKVYLQQKNYKKAIQAYKILILKNPEKSGFFADQIRAIEKLINPEAQ